MEVYQDIDLPHNTGLSDLHYTTLRQQLFSHWIATFHLIVELINTLPQLKRITFCELTITDEPTSHPLFSEPLFNSMLVPYNALEFSVNDDEQEQRVVPEVLDDLIYNVPPTDIRAQYFHKLLGMSSLRLRSARLDAQFIDLLAPSLHSNLESLTRLDIISSKLWTRGLTRRLEGILNDSDQIRSLSLCAADYIEPFPDIQPHTLRLLKSYAGPAALLPNLSVTRDFETLRIVETGWVTTLSFLKRIPLSSGHTVRLLDLSWFISINPDQLAHASKLFPFLTELVIGRWKRITGTPGMSKVTFIFPSGGTEYECF